ncbi:MAG: hypothetical protein JJT85_00455 [Chromatiales bacterium]|nr:hypothetical protein [Chromatiales bacterium]
MMSEQEFLSSPWKREHSHPAFNDSSFSIRPAPEFSTGEVVLSSLYRAAGFDGVSEKQVPSLGNDFRKALDKERRRQRPAGRLSPEAWRTVVDRLVQSPKVSKQSSKRFLSLSPVIPDTALYAGAARLSGNPWNPGQLIRHIITLGSPTPTFAERTWAELHEALSVAADDDVWARWLQTEFEPRRPEGVHWQPTRLQLSDPLPEADRREIAYPSKQFTTDLLGVMGAKSAMTRRQWITLIEALLRIGSVSHVLWLCDVTDRLWRAVRAALEGRADAVLDGPGAIRSEILSVRRRMLSFGNPAVPAIRDLASRYLSARLGINCVLWALENLEAAPKQLASSHDIHGFLATISSNAEALKRRGVIGTFNDLQDREVRTICCKKGVGANLLEFSQYTLGQRQTMEQALRGYDQGYFLRKKGDARNAPWVLSLGPAAVLAMVHCCLHAVEGPRSVQRLALHLGAYGIEFDLHGVNDSTLGRQLRMLGLVLDSPDAESGMLLVPPFAA